MLSRRSRADVTIGRPPRPAKSITRRALFSLAALGLLALPSLAQQEPPPGWKADTLRLQPDSTREFPESSRSSQELIDAFRRSAAQRDPAEMSEEMAAQRRFQSRLASARQFEFMGQHERALDLYRELSEEQPEHRAVFDGLRRNLLALGQYDKAEQLIQQRIDMPNTRTAELYAELGGVQWEAGREEAANASWEAALAARPVSDRNYEEVASVMLRQRLLDRAIEVYQRGRDELDNDLLFAINLAGLYTSMMDWEAASDEYINILRQTNRRTHYVRRGFANFPNKPAADEAALDAIERELDRPRRDDPWEGYRAFLHELVVDQKKKNADYAGALPAVADLDDLQHADGGTLLEFATEAMDEGFQQVASGALDLAAERMDDPEGRDVIDLMRAGIHQRRGEFQQAAELYGVVIEDPASDRIQRAAHMSRGLLALQELDDPRRAVRDFRAVRQLGWPEQDRRLDYSLAHALVRVDSLGAALETLSRSVASEPGRPNRTPVQGDDDMMVSQNDLNHFAARILLWSGDRQRATTLMDSILSPTTGADSENETLLMLHLLTTVQDSAALDLYAKADRAWFQNRPDRALALYDSLLQQEDLPEIVAVEAGYNAAMIRLERDGDTEAVAHFANEHGDHPRVEEAWYELGRYWLERDNPEEAAVAFEMVLVAAPDGLLQGLARLRLDEINTPLFLPEGEG